MKKVKGKKIMRHPAGTQRYCNVANTLQKHRDVAQRINIVVMTLHEQRYSNMLQQSCSNVTNTLFVNRVDTTLLNNVVTTLLNKAFATLPNNVVATLLNNVFTTLLKIVVAKLVQCCENVVYNVGVGYKKVLLFPNIKKLCKDTTSIMFKQVVATSQ